MPSYSTGRGGDYYAAVELAVKATGTGALRDLESALQANGQALQALQGMYASGAIKLDEFRTETAKFKREQAELTEAIAAANRVLAGQPAALQQTKAGFNGAAQAALAFSRGLEDVAVTGGNLMGGLNNIPAVVRGIGTALNVAGPQLATAEAAVSGLATGAYVLYRNWTTLKGLFDNGLGPKLVDDLKSVNAELKALTDKDWRTRIEVQDLENIKAQAKELQGIKAAIEAQKGPTKEEEARGKVFNEAVKAADYNNVARAISGSMGPIQDSAATIEARRRLKEQQDYMESARYRYDVGISLGAAAPYAESQLSSLKEQLEAAKGADVQNRNAAVERFLGEAGQGNEKTRQFIQDLFDRNRDRFEGAGVGQSFRDAIAKASVAEQDRAAAAAKAEKSDEQVERDAAAIGDQPVKDIEALVRKFREGFMDRLEADFYETLKSVPPADRLGMSKRLVDARTKAIAAELSNQTGFDPTDMRNMATARRLLEEGATGASNAITSGQPPKLIQQGQRDQDRAIADEVKRMAPGVADQIERALLTRQARGASPEDAAAGVLPSLTAWLEKQGVAADKLGKVAAAILDKTGVGIAQDLAKLGPIPLQQAAAQQLMTVLDKIEAKLTADQKRAAGNENNRQIQAFANAYQSMTGESNARSLDAGRRAAQWFGSGYSEDEAMAAAMAEMSEAGIQRGERFDQLGRGGRPADKAARDARTAQRKAEVEAKKRRDAEWKRRMGKGAGPAPENGNGGGLLSVPPSMPAGDQGGLPNPKALAPTSSPESALVAINRELSAALGQANARLQRLEQAGLAMANNMRLMRQRQNRNVNQAPALAAPSPFR